VVDTAEIGTVMEPESLEIIDEPGSESRDMDEDSLDSEEDGLRQLLLLQQTTKYWLFSSQHCVTVTGP